jgi:hypothetical protein
MKSNIDSEELRRVKCIPFRRILRALRKIS